MGLFKKNKGSGGQKALVIGAPTGFRHVAGDSNMALTARPIGAETDAVLAAPGEGSSLAPKPDSRAAEVSTWDLTALPVAPPARKGLAKKLLSAFRGRKAKGQTAAAAPAAASASSSPPLPAAPAVSAASSSSESAPASRPATPLSVSPVRPSAGVAPRIPALGFVAAPASPRAEALAALSASRSVAEPTNVVASAAQKRMWRETSIIGSPDGQSVWSSPSKPS